MAPPPTVEAKGKDDILDELASRPVLVFSGATLRDNTAPDNETNAGALALSYGQLCSCLRLVLDCLAWRLQATGVLRLSPPPVTLAHVSFLFDLLDR